MDRPRGWKVTFTAKPWHVAISQNGRSYHGPPPLGKHSQMASDESTVPVHVISYLILQSLACSSQAPLHCNPIAWQYFSHVL